MSTAYKFHQLSEIFPLLDRAETEYLAEDIKKNGQRTRITIFDNQILDGRNRYRACLLAEVEPKFQAFAGGDPLAFIISANLRRRHLDTSQRAMVAAKLATMRKGQPKRNAPIGTLLSKNNQNTNDNESFKEISQPVAAKALNVSRTSVQRATVVLKTGTKADVKAVEDGKVSLHKASTKIAIKTKVATVRVDKIGTVVPVALVKDWDRAEAFKDELAKLRSVKKAVAAGLDSSDIIFREVTNTTLARITNTIGDLERVLPYAVCTSCNGHKPDRCVLCKGRGWLSAFLYKTAVPEEVRNVREKSGETKAL